MKQISIYDHETGETIVRDMTADELAEYEKSAQEVIDRKEAEAAAAQQRETVLEALAASAGLDLADVKKALA